MKKVLIASLLVVVTLGLFVGAAGAQALTAQSNTGALHEYIEQALASKLGISQATVEEQFDTGKSLYQIALDNGIAQADLSTFMQEVRAEALKAAVKDGVITQAQADWMNQHGFGRMSGRGMMNGGFGRGMMNGGTGPCDGTGIPVGDGLQRGARWQQANP